MKVIVKVLIICLLACLFLNFFTLRTQAAEKLDVVYFYSAKCLSCKENKSFIEELKTIKGINLLLYDTDEQDYSDMQYAYAKHYNVGEESSLSVPMIYFGDKHYELSPSYHEQVRTEILQYTSGELSFTNFKYEGDGQSAFDVFLSNMTIPGILLAGLLDGINPCAISMLIVFYSFLLMTENKKKIVGMSTLFIIGIFLANLTFGLGVKYFYDDFAGNAFVLYGLYGVAIAMCLFAIVLNTIDIINRNKNIESKNQLPDRIKFKLATILRNSAFSKFAAIVALGVGLLIGVVELACTGQIYFPTLTYMVQNTNYGLVSILLLVAYNIMFVLPLITITIIAGLVKEPEKIKAAIMKRNWIIKLAANIFFVIMTIILINQMLTF